jgi:hypothetical protein
LQKRLRRRLARADLPGWLIEDLHARRLVASGCARSALKKSGHPNDQKSNEPQLSSSAVTGFLVIGPCASYSGVF